MADDRDFLKSIGQTLDGTNYQVWAKMMKFFMIGNEVWDIVTGVFPEPVDEHKPDFVKNKAKWEKNNAKIITWINNSVDKTIQIELSKFDTAKDCWDHLKKIFSKSNYAREYQLEIDIRAARQKDSTIQQFYHEMTALWDQLDMVDSTELLVFQPYADKRKRQKLFQFLLALRDDFETIRGSILHRNPLPELDAVVSELLAEEDRLKTQASHFATMQTPTVLVASHRSSNTHRQSKNRGPQPNDECRYCHGKGHWTTNCPILGRGDQSSQHHSSGNTSQASNSSSSAVTGSDSALATLTSQIQQLIDKHVGGTQMAAPTIFEKTTEKGQNGESRDLADLSPAVLSLRKPESEEMPQKSFSEKQQENQDLLIKCMSQDLGFSAGRPVTSCLIYKCLLHWRSFEVEGTNLFDRIIQALHSAIEVHENIDLLSYWLSNTSTLVWLLQRTLKSSGASSLNPQRRRSTSPFGRMTQGLRGPPQNAGISFINGRVQAGVDDSQYVEAKYPALLFKQQLTALLEKIYGLIRDNLKKEVSPVLGLCIQAPRTSHASLVKGSLSQQYLLAHWESIVKILKDYLKALRENYVPPILVRNMFTQIFSFVNVQLFNSVLLRRECCSFSYGEFMEHGLAEFERWCFTATEEYAGSAWDELKHIRQAAGFLVIHQKPKKTLKEITKDLCPVLSVRQLYRISTMYWDDKYGTHSVSSDVISSMRVLMTVDSNNAVSSSFLLDDDSGIPFSLDDISKSTEQIDIADIEPPPFLRENSEFHFLLQPAE